MKKRIMAVVLSIAILFSDSASVLHVTESRQRPMFLRCCLVIKRKNISLMRKYRC